MSKIQTVSFSDDVYAELKRLERITPGVKFSTLVVALLRKSLNLPLCGKAIPRSADEPDGGITASP